MVTVPVKPEIDAETVKFLADGIRLTVKHALADALRELAGLIEGD